MREAVTSAGEDLPMLEVVSLNFDCLHIGLPCLGLDLGVGQVTATQE